MRDRVGKEMVRRVLARIVPRNWVLWRGAEQSRAIALTFDDGPHGKFTTECLEILEENDTRATFFLVGERIENELDIARQIVERGHEVGSHTYSHRSCKEVGIRCYVREIRKGVEVLEQRLGVKSATFRPPCLEFKLGVILYCVSKGVTCVFGSRISEDWRRISEEDIERKVGFGDLGGGEIIVFHDDNEFTLNVLRRRIKWLKERGFEFVTVSEFKKDGKRRREDRACGLQ